MNAGNKAKPAIKKFKRQRQQWVQAVSKRKITNAGGNNKPIIP
jgi:hypothetical protein